MHGASLRGAKVYWARNQSKNRLRISTYNCTISININIFYYWCGRLDLKPAGVSGRLCAMQSRKENTMPIESVGKGSFSILPPQVDTPLRKQAELASLARNLASQRWAEEALAESEARYRIVAQTAVDAIVTIDEDGEILFVNPSAEKIFGYPTSDMLGRSLKLLLPGYSPTEDRNPSQQREMTGKHKDGRQVALEVSFGHFTQGSQTLATGILRDVSARRQAEEARRVAEEALRHTNETMRALIEATPLAIIAFT